MTYFKTTLIAAACVFLSGCGGPPSVSAANVTQAKLKCGGEKVCATFSLAADELNSKKVKSFGAGVRMLNATAEKKNLLIDLEVPTRVKDLPGSKASISKSFSNSMREGLCGKGSQRRTMDEIFALGGVIDVTLYLPSKEVFSMDTLKSCSPT